MEVIPKLTSATLDLQATCKDATEQEGRTLQDEDHPKPSAQMFSFARARLPQTAAAEASIKINCCRLCCPHEDLTEFCHGACLDGFSVSCDTSQLSW